MAVAIGIALLSEKYLGKLGLTVGSIIGLFVAGLLIMGLKRLNPYLEKLDVKAKAYKRFPYSERYGRNYPQPTPGDFGITQDEFDEYNSRFQFEFIRLIFTYGIWISACIYLLRAKLNGSQAIFLIGGAAATAILLDYVFNYWNKKLSQRHHCYKKIHEFQEALKIYFKIRDENLGI